MMARDRLNVVVTCGNAESTGRGRVTTLVYHLGADRSGAHRKWTGPGTVVAAAIWTGISAVLSWYAGSIGHYGRTYRSITGGVVLVL